MSKYCVEIVWNFFCAIFPKIVFQGVQETILYSTFIYSKGEERQRTFSCAPVRPTDSCRALSYSIRNKLPVSLICAVPRNSRKPVTKRLPSRAGFSLVLRTLLLRKILKKNPSKTQAFCREMNLIILVFVGFHESGQSVPTSCVFY